MTYSHMGEPHYHWRYDVSLLSSGRDQVGPSRYCRQQRGLDMSLLFLLFDYKCLVYGRSTCNLTESRLKVISKYSFLFYKPLQLIQDRLIRLVYKPLGCCMVKPNEQLVQVSYTHRCASTPCLSTS